MNPSSLIPELIESSQGKVLTGAELSVLVRHQQPDFSPESYDCRNLRDFIRKNVSSVYEIGRRGADIVYGLEQPKQEKTEQPEEAEKILGLYPNQFYSSGVWKTFVSPSKAYRLYVNPVSGQHKIVTLAQEPPVDVWKQVPSVSPEKHLKIAKEFLDKVEDKSVRSAIEATLAMPQWWRDIYESLEGFGLIPAWNHFKKERLTQEFRETLQSVGVAPEGITVLTATKRIDSKIRKPGSSVRKVAISAVSRMSELELRRLRLPLGYVLDALKKAD